MDLSRNSRENLRTAEDGTEIYDGDRAKIYDGDRTKICIFQNCVLRTGIIADEFCIS